MNQLPRCRQAGVLATSICLLLLCFVSTASAQNGDVAVTKATGSTIVPPDTDVVFEVIVSNTSEESAPGPTVLMDDIPANMTFVSASVDPAYAGAWCFDGHDYLHLHGRAAGVRNSLCFFLCVSR
jgi:uncharacterized repeat protein (TIGR01451 family)